MGSNRVLLVVALVALVAGAMARPAVLQPDGELERTRDVVSMLEELERLMQMDEQAGQAPLAPAAAPAAPAVVTNATAAAASNATAAGNATAVAAPVEDVRPVCADPRLVASWPLDNAHLFDASPHQCDLTFEPADDEELSLTNGRFDQAVEFRENIAKASLPPASVRKSLTLSFYLKVLKRMDVKFLTLADQSGQKFEVHLSQYKTPTSFELRFNSNDWDVGSGFEVSSSWTHVAIVTDGNVVNFYINGMLETSNEIDSDFALNAEELVAWLGNSPSTFPDVKEGANVALDDVALFNDALLPCEVHTLYERGVQSWCAMHSEE